MTRAESSDRRRLIVITDLDGCLLDAETYSYDAARPALAGLSQAGCPVVLCSGKTRAEMEPLARALELGHPFIVENGGAVIFPEGCFELVPGAREEGGCRILELGFPRQRLIEALSALAAEAGLYVRGFAAMTPLELHHLTGLSETAAQLALRRDYDEPFLLEDEAELGALCHAASRYGLQVTHGGRFFHLSGGSDKGLAVRTLLAHYERAGQFFTSVGFGDAATDVSLLRAVDRPILVPRADGALDATLASNLPGAERAPLPGPAGWNASVLALLQGEGLPKAPAGASPQRPR